MSSLAGSSLAGAVVCGWSQSLASIDADDCVVADAHGKFELKDRDLVGLVAAADGYLPERRELASQTRAARNESVSFRLQQRESGSWVSGVVRDVSGGEVPGALVASRGESSNENEMTALTIADENGTFRIAAPSGWLDLSAKAPSYAPAKARVYAPESHVDLVLAPASSIAGRVLRRGDGATVAGVTVTVGGAAIASAQSDEDGFFEIAGLTAGAYELQAFSAELRTATVQVALGLGETAEAVLLVADSATYLHANLTLSSGTCPDGYAQIAGPVTAQRPLDSSGDVQFDGLLPGHYEVRVACPTHHADIEESIEVGSAPVARSWRADIGLNVSGTVTTPSGSPVSGITVRIERAERSAAEPGALCTTDEAGAFHCGGLRAGEYVGRALSQSGVVSAEVPLSLAGASLAEVTLITAPLGMIRVLPSAASDGSPGASVLPVAFHDGAPHIYAEREGDHYVFPKLGLGNYLVQLGVDGESSASAARVRLERDQQLVEVRLQPPPRGEVRGIVSDQDGTPVADAWVDIVQTNPAWLMGIASVPRVLSDAEGAFSIPGLLPGTYSLQASSPLARTAPADVVPGQSGVSLRLARN